MLYHILTTHEADVLNPHLHGIKRLVLQRADNAKVREALQRAIDSELPTIKHAFILYCLHAEKSFREYIGTRSNARVVGEFVNGPLEKFVHASLTGYYPSLREFVNDARNEYVTT